MRCILFIICFSFSFIAVAQMPENFWQVLAEVGFESKLDKQYGYEIDVPKFSRGLQAWNGKQIKLKGYLIPLSELGDKQVYMLSALPFNLCFFCGGAGPETVIELDIKEKLKFSTSAVLMEGKLELNASDPEHHMYILREAKLVK
ncbi:MAG TPA: hypothetical protein PKC24_10515 [Cyclobacteriaceae bacterium]|nr:hypothetical protein [Cyclobacteriaceae bacterium]